MRSKKVQLRASAIFPSLAEYRFSLEFYVFKEQQVYIAYCPAFDISSSGKDFNDAVKNFYECFQLHIEYCVSNGTLLADLISHGWKVRKDRLTPPSFVSLLKHSTMKALVSGDISYERIVTPARLPALA